MKIKKLNLDITFIILCILLVIPIGLSLFYLFKNYLKIDDANGYNSIDSVIGVLSVTLNIITVISIFITYKSQQKQIKDNNKDLEFNRALEIIYKQLEYTNKRFNKINNPLSGLYYSYIHTTVIELRKDINNVTYNKALKEHPTTIIKLLTFFNKEFQLYKDILNVQGIDYNSRLKLINIITWNISTYFKTDIIEFKDIYERLVTKEIEIIKENDATEVTTEVINNLDKIISFLNADFSGQENER